MNALDQGAKDGRDFTSRFPIEKMTINGYRVMGRATAKRRYRQAQAQESYLQGWMDITVSFHSLFKPDDEDVTVALAKIDITQKLLETQRENIEKLLSWREDDFEVQALLQDASNQIRNAQDDLNELLNMLKEREQ